MVIVEDWEGANSPAIPKRNWVNSAGNPPKSETKPVDPLPVKPAEDWKTVLDSVFGVPQFANDVKNTAATTTTTVKETVTTVKETLETAKDAVNTIKESIDLFKGLFS